MADSNQNENVETRNDSDDVQDAMNPREIQQSISSDQFAELSEIEQRFYRRNDQGDYVPNISGIDNLPGLLKTLEIYKSSEKTMKKEIDELKKEVRKGLLDKASESVQETEERKRLRQALEQVEQEHGQKEAKLTERIESLQNELREIKLTDKIRAKALDHGVFRDRVDAFLRLTSDRFELAENDVIIPLNKSGHPLMGKTLDDFFADELKPEFDYLFESKRLSGGAGGESRGGVTTSMGGTRNLNKTRLPGEVYEYKPGEVLSIDPETLRKIGSNEASLVRQK